MQMGRLKARARPPAPPQRRERRVCVPNLPIIGETPGLRRELKMYF